jgi:hypothetical protein
MKEVKPSARRAGTAAAKTATAPARKPVSRAKTAPAGPDPKRQVMIAMAAYYRAERRGFVPGHELEDWLAAEAELSATVAPAPAPAKKGPVRARKTTG